MRRSRCRRNIARPAPRAGGAETRPPDETSTSTDSIPKPAAPDDRAGRYVLARASQPTKAAPRSSGSNRPATRSPAAASPTDHRHPHGIARGHSGATPQRPRDFGARRTSGAPPNSRSSISPARATPNRYRATDQRRASRARMFAAPIAAGRSFAAAIARHDGCDVVGRACRRDRFGRLRRDVRLAPRRAAMPAAARRLAPSDRSPGGRLRRLPVLVPGRPAHGPSPTAGQQREPGRELSETGNSNMPHSTAVQARCWKLALPCGPKSQHDRGQSGQQQRPDADVDQQLWSQRSNRPSDYPFLGCFLGRDVSFRWRRSFGFRRSARPVAAACRAKRLRGRPCPTASPRPSRCTAFE